MKKLLPRTVAALALLIFLSPATTYAAAPVPVVNLLRTPDGGLQPQAVVDAKGALHLIWLKGDPKACDVFYARREAGRTNFSTPQRVNSEAGSAVAVGTIRGAQLALGRNDRVHVAWNGSGTPKPERGAPMLYTRLDDAGDAFEPQRNLMTSGMHLDGGGSVAADGAGNVFVVWHAAPEGVPNGEQHRAVFMAKSSDDGKSFADGRRVNPAATGACACCGLKAFVEKRGRLCVLYRAAAGGLDRDVTLLVSNDGGQTFTNRTLGPWRVGMCPMSSMALAQGAGGDLLAAWETEGQVFDAAIALKTLGVAAPHTPEGKSGNRKHPVIAVSVTGEVRRTLRAWTEGTGWQKGGSLAWELTDAASDGTTMGRARGVPVWGRITTVAEADGTFTIIY